MGIPIKEIPEQPIMPLYDSGDPTGFVDPANINVSYNSTTRKITLTHASGIIEYYWKSLKRTLPSPWVSDAHADTAGPKYLSSSDGITFTWSNSVWTFDIIQVAYVADGKIFALRECHGLMPHRVHETLHSNISTYRKSGFGLTAGTYELQPASETDAKNLFGLDAGVITDEDLDTTLAAWIEGTYTTLHFTTSGVPNFTLDANHFIRITGTYPNINQWSGTAFSEVETTTNRYLNYYVLRLPVTSDTASQKYRAIVLQPQVAYSSLANAQAELFGSLYLGEFFTLTPESVAVERITLRTASSYTTTGKVRIEAVATLTTTRAQQTANVVNANILRIGVASSGALDFANYDYLTYSSSANYTVILANIPVGRFVYHEGYNSHASDTITIAIPGVKTDGGIESVPLPAGYYIRFEIFNDGTNTTITWGSLII